MSVETRTHVIQVGRVIVPVSDQDRALEFYVGNLGFEKRLDVAFDEGSARWVEVAPPGATTTIALIPPRRGMFVGADREELAQESPGIDTRISFTSEDVEADHAALRARGVDVDPEILRVEGAPPMFFFRDQDRNALLIVQRV